MIIYSNKFLMKYLYKCLNFDFSLKKNSRILHSSLIGEFLNLINVSNRKKF